MTLAAQKAVCPHCGFPMASTGAPIWDDYCTNKECTAERDAMFARIAARGKEQAALNAAARDLVSALKALLERHVELVSCGDCGNWDVEQEEAVIAARAALLKAQPTPAPSTSLLDAMKRNAE